jgi:hypothetical protein
MTEEIKLESIEQEKSSQPKPHTHIAVMDPFNEIYIFYADTDKHGEKTEDNIWRFYVNNNNGDVQECKMLDKEFLAKYEAGETDLQPMYLILCAIQIKNILFTAEWKPLEENAFDSLSKEYSILKVHSVMKVSLDKDGNTVIY